MTVSVLWFRGLLQAAENIGMDKASLLANTEIKEEQLAAPYARLTMEQNLKLWRAIEQQAEIENVGLAIGAHVKPSYFQLLALTLVQSPNLGEALNKSMRYTRLLSDGGTYCLQETATDAALCYEPLDKSFSDHQIDAVMVLLYNFASWLACENIPLKAVELNHPLYGDRQTYEQIFSAPVKFSAGRNALVLERATLSAPLSLTDSYLAQLHEQMLENQLALVSQQNMANLVRHHLRSIEDLTINREDLAYQLNISSRSLQRKLKECDSNFQTLLDEERYSRARQLLKQTQLSLTDISAQLGFAESSVFTRAFKRWSGIPPLEYRQHQQRLGS